ncbi:MULTISPECIES: hypothetical protein [unclassified Wenzhouxiangella]|uniref:hypothetical protein n=1 Tax=unclassified Wenzhouxiangella TaxID=2613841 RepID=UPI000E325BB2|nr:MULTISPECIES: hypothetical protein [unclassified Wenzhouxiangella]RFF28174.1 hypothetical protein DZK25_04080 [Wenzhouxiangella sp. 15181]RFP67959.1 hypothetical protein DZK26_10345 [Wenzhouxiangella sp. 15190]
MFSTVEKSGTGIGKSGTGIEKSGTGIEKSGTGIEKSGTGIRRWQILSLVACILFATQGLATEPQVLVSTGNDQVLVSVHSDDGILVGRAEMPDQSGYYQLALYSAVGPVGSDAVFQPMVAGSGSGSSKEVAGSGSGSSKEVAGSGSGSSKEVAGSGSGSSKEVAGSGSGSAGESCDSGTGLMVAGSGSGSAGEGCDAQVLVAGSGSGSAGEACDSGGWLDVAGSGSGSAGESTGCAYPTSAWGIAEVVVDRSGAHVVVHRIKGSQAEEFLVAFLPGSNGEFADSPRQGLDDRGFVATP